MSVEARIMLLLLLLLLDRAMVAKRHTLVVMPGVIAQEVRRQASRP